MGQGAADGGHRTRILRGLSRADHSSSGRAVRDFRHGPPTKPPSQSAPEVKVAMKDWIRGHPYLALALGYVLVYALAAAVGLVFDPRHPATVMLRAFTNTLIYWLFALFRIRNVRKTKQRLDARGQFRAFLRYPNSRPGSLSGIWNQGIATPGSGSIRFQPAVYDNLEPSGRPTELKVREVLPERRKVGGKERRYMPAYGFQAVTLLTDEGNVELAASPESLDGLVRAVASGPMESAGPDSSS